MNASRLFGRCAAEPAFDILRLSEAGMPRSGPGESGRPPPDPRRARPFRYARCGCPRRTPSVVMCVLAFNPPRDFPNACLLFFLRSTRVRMDFHRDRIRRSRRYPPVRRMLFTESLRNPFRRAVFSPAVYSHANRMPGAEGRGRRSPFTAVFADTHGGVRKDTVIDSHISASFRKEADNLPALFSQVKYILFP
jgi:hypothetical protein